MVSLALLLLAATPLPNDLAACPLLEDALVFNEDCDSCFKVRRTALGGEKRYHLYTLSYGSGRDGSFTESHWLANPSDCSAVALEIEGGAGSPLSTTRFRMHQRKTAVTDTEQRALQELAKFVAADAADPRDQLSLRREGHWSPGAPQPQRTSWQRRDHDLGEAGGSCPCFDVFAGDAFKKQRTLTLGSSKLHLYATAARNQSWAFALERAGRMSWNALGTALELNAQGTRDGKFLFERVDRDEQTAQPLQIDGETGAVTGGNARRSAVLSLPDE